MLSLHKNATTTPAIRARIAASDVLRTNRFDSALDLEQTLMRYVVRRSLEPMAFMAHTTRNCRSQP